MKLKTSIVVSYIVAVIVFFMVALWFQYHREREYKNNLLNRTLENVDNDVFDYIQHNSIANLDSFTQRIEAPEVRITVIDTEGVVWYDNKLNNVSKLENHGNRPEIMKASQDSIGVDIRYSNSMHQPYYYVAKKYGDIYVRSSLRYDVSWVSLFRLNNEYLYLILLVTIVVVSLFGYILYALNVRAKHRQMHKDTLMRKRLTQQIAHELKTPLSGIVGYIETLKNDAIPVDKKHYFLDRCLAQAQSLNMLLEDILLLYKIDDAPQFYDMQQVILHDVLANIVEDVQIALHKKKMCIDNEIQENIKIQGNRMLLYSIFYNLINNAIAYAGEGTSITIKLLGESNRFYTILFYDDGIGIPPQHLKHIFERFYRVDKGRSRAMGGTGLGLSIVKNAVEIHQGNIQALNRKTGGLEFIIQLPKGIV